MDSLVRVIPVSSRETIFQSKEDLCMKLIKYGMVHKKVHFVYKSICFLCFIDFLQKLTEVIFQNSYKQNCEDRDQFHQIHQLLTNHRYNRYHRHTNKMSLHAVFPASFLKITIVTFFCWLWTSRTWIWFQKSLSQLAEMLLGCRRYHTVYFCMIGLPNWAWVAEMIRFKYEENCILFISEGLQG